MSEDNNDNGAFGIRVEQINIEAVGLENELDPNALLLLPTRNLVLFPEVSISISLKRESSEQIAQLAYDRKVPIGIVCQKNPDDETPTLKRGLYQWGVVADVIKVLELPDGEKTALVKAREAFKIVKSAGKKRGMGNALVAQVELVPEVPPTEGDRGYNTIIKSIRRALKKIAPALDEGLPHFIAHMMNEMEGPAYVNALATNLPLETAEKEDMLREPDLKKRAMLLLKALSMKEQEVAIAMDIMSQVRAELDEDQRRTILQKQLDTIHDQLYGGSDDADRLEALGATVDFTPEARQAFNREMGKLRKMNPQNPDYFVSLNYLETLTRLPWGIATEPNRDFKKAQEELDRDHCGLEKVKERVLEHMAVVMHNPGGKAPILCLVGPPGVGKTSLGRSVASALGREYQRVSFGGLHDEAEIRGHRRTYIGAMPGRIVDAIAKAKVVNPVLVLDEIDKIGADYKGDPAAALLEVLDPEQNCHFHDNYIDVDLDLSHVLFIATANTTATIARPLLDRMEVINLSGYLAEEKAEIARRHLLRRVCGELNISPEELNVSDEALNAIIDNYTSESGVRQLEKLLSTIGRKYLLAKMSGKEFPQVVEPQHLADLLGVAPHIKEKYEGNAYAGVATGLAWTEAGGEIILAEASLSPGKGAETVTGNLGQVMKESASIAYQWVKAHSQQLGIDPALFEKYNLHIHFPEGAIPKDGPSAGITIATAIVSAFTQKRVKAGLAMTGEITLRGKVLPVGGIKEKMLAAKRAGIKEIVLSADNRKDVDDIPAKYTEGLEFRYVNTVLEVMAIAITDEAAANALTL